MTCHTQLSNLEIAHIDAVKCVQRQVQQTLSEVQVVVHAEFEATISARVSPIIVLKVFLVERLGIALGLWSLKLKMASFWTYLSRKGRT